MIPSQPPPDLNETDWIVQVNESVRHMPSKSDEERYWKRRSIYRVPACITDLNQKAYWPQAVSFGPYHHGKPHLLPMEEHKHRALRHFLWRSKKQVEPFLESLRQAGQDLEDSYDTLDRKWKESGSEGAAGRFLELMIIDGCFMLETLRTNTDQQDDYRRDDPIFGDVGLLQGTSYIKRDMLMLENQLPMQVLERLVTVESDGKRGHEYINQLILEFYEGTYIEGMGKCLHVLDVLKKSLLFHETMQPHLDDAGNDWSEQIIRSATELKEAGIQLKKSETRNLMDISFADGVLRLPATIVDDFTECKFLNLMTFERFHFGPGNGVTAYVFFMDGIIDTQHDITLLRTQGIIQNVLGSNKEVADLFNSLTKDVTLHLNFANHVHSVQKKITEHCEKPWNMWRTNLIHTYFRNPWSILSLIAAIFLFALTIIQTVYGISSYYK